MSCCRSCCHPVPAVSLPITIPRMTCQRRWAEATVVFSNSPPTHCFFSFPPIHQPSGEYFELEPPNLKSYGRAIDTPDGGSEFVDYPTILCNEVKKIGAMPIFYMDWASKRSTYQPTTAPPVWHCYRRGRPFERDSKVVCTRAHAACVLFKAPLTAVSNCLSRMYIVRLINNVCPINL